MQDVWQRRIERANELARANAGASRLLAQYAAILAAQRTCYEQLLAQGLTGSLETDLAALQRAAADLFDGISAAAPAQAMRDVPTEASGIASLLRAGWRAPDMSFPARVVLQPYAEALRARAGAEDGAGVERHLEIRPGQAACPFCGGIPQVAVLQSMGADGPGRALVCGTCATTWAAPRIRCAYCGEEEERRLGYFHSADIDHVRIDACDTCRRYLKTVDLTRLGIAVPIVDEVASGALDIWARERGYTKLTPNLIGL